MDLRLAGSRRFRSMVSAALVLARLLVTSGESWAANYFGSIHVASTKVRNYNDSIFAAAASVPHPMRYLESGNEANNPTAFAIASNEPAESPDTSQSAPHPSVVSNAPTVVVLRKPTSKPTEERTHNPTGSPTYPPRNLLTIDPSRWSIPSPLSEPSQTPSDEESFLQTLSPSQKLSRNLSTNPTQKSARLHTISPTYFSTNGPTSNQTQRPSSKESPSPTIAPSSKPSKKLTGRPSSSPTIPPTLSPSRVPTQFPTSNPSHQPTYAPTLQPSKKPTRKPTRSPTIAPTIIFTKVSSKSPTQYSTANPSRKPTPKPSLVPTSVPSSKPTNLSKAPAKVPIQIPPPNPSQRPFLGPSTPSSNAPSSKPTNQPTRRPPRPPTPPPTRESTISPSKNPIQFPTPNPSRRPSSQPSPLPSNAPSSRPTNQPTRRPSRPPTSPPTNKSTFSPSKNPIPFPTPNPSRRPSSKPSPLPSNAPSRKPTNQPTIMPFQSPTSALTNISTKSPSDTPTHLRTFIPSLKVTEKPSSKVSPAPSRRPTNEPFRFPTNQTQIPSRVSTRGPSKTPPNETESNPSRTGYPTDVSTINPAHPPSSRPSIKPTQILSSRPFHAPTQKPSRSPTKSPTQVPSRESDSSPLSLVHDQINYLPSLSPSETSPDFPLLNLSNFPTKVPLVLTSSNPSSFPSGLSDFPTKTIDSKTKPVASPTNDPTALPSLAATSTPFSAFKLGTSMPTESYATMDALLHFKVQFNRPFTDAELGTFEDSLESFLEDNLDGKNFSVQISQYNATVISQTIETEESIGGRALETSSSLIVSAYVVAIGIPAVRANDFPFQLFTHEALSENSDAFYDSFFSSSGFHQDDSSLTQQEGSIKFPRSGSVENDEGRQSQSKSTPIAVGSFAGAFCLFTTAAVLLLLMRRRLNRTASDGDEEQPPSAQAMEDDVSSLDGSDDGCITGRDRYPKNIPHLPGHNDRLTPEPSAVATGIKNAADTSNTIFASDRWSLDETCRLEKNTTSDQLNDPYFSGDSSHDSSIVAPMKLDVFVPVTDDFDYTDPPAVVKENFEDSNAKDASKMESKQKLHSKEIGENDEEFGRCSQDDFVDLVEDEPVQVKGRRKGLGMFSCFTDHTFQEVSDQSLSAPQLFGAKFTSRVSTPRSSGIEYEVRAPPGPLGLVVDSSNRGLVIHSVKPNSPLSNQVQAGDVILSLDGANCTKMSPEDLGNWISSKPLKEKQTVRLLAINDDELSV